jgi:hypothetical protein
LLQAAVGDAHQSLLALIIRLLDYHQATTMQHSVGTRSFSITTNLNSRWSNWRSQVITDKQDQPSGRRWPMPPPK